MNNFIEKLEPTNCNECNFDYANCKGCLPFCKADMVNAYEQGKADAIDEFSKWLVEQDILPNRVICDGEITDYGKVFAKRYKEQLKEK